MKNKLREPTNPRNLPWGGVLLGLLGFFLIYISEPPEYFVDVFGPIDAILTSLGFIGSYAMLMLGLWAVLRIHLLQADHDKFNLGDAIIPAFFGVFFCIAPIIIYDVIILDTLTLIVTKLVVLLGFGAFLALLAEAMIAHANQEHELQAQGLRRFRHDQEMMIKEIAVIAFVSEAKVSRALGYHEKVSASAAREWLEGAKGIRCPPAEKKLAG